MDDSDKVAAAILAAEASRQKLQITQSQGGHNIPGEIMTFYRYFLAQLSKPLGS